MKNFHVISILLSLYLFSCEKETIKGIDEQKDKAKINFINASPDAKPPYNAGLLAMWFNYNDKDYYTNPIAFPWSSQYLAISPGQINVKIDTARAIGQALNRATVLNFPINVEKDSYYSLYSIGTAQKPDYLFFKEDLSLPSQGKVKVRFLNLSQDAGTIDIVNVVSNTALATGLTYKTLSEFIEIDPADYINVRIRDNATGAFISPPNRRILLEKNNIYTVWATGIRTTFTGINHTLRLSYHANRYTF